MNDATLTQEQAPVISAQSGDMGLRGMLGQVFHSTAMVCIVAIAFLCLYQIVRMHTEAIDTFRAFNDQLVVRIQGSIDSNTRALIHLGEDIRNLRSN
jgi:hypothetical protein